MHRAAGFGITRLQRPLMAVQAGVFRQKRGVNVEHTALVAAHEAGGQDAHETGSGDDIGLGGVKLAGQFRLKPGTIRAEPAMIDAGGWNAQAGGFGQPRRVGLVGEHQNRAGRMVAGHRRHQRHHVRPTPRKEDGHPLHSKRPA